MLCFKASENVYNLSQLCSGDHFVTLWTVHQIALFCA
jgi:hypothetical protein